MAKTPKPIAGKVVAITGGARGIGYATAQALASQGAKVSIGDLDYELAKKSAESLSSESYAHELNVTERDSFEAFLDATEQQLGPIDVLVNNAGIMQIGKFLDEDDATAQRQIDINLSGLIFGMKIAIPKMLAHGGGHIVNIASQAGKLGYPGGATYSATKHAVVGLSDAVRAEMLMAGSPIEITAVMPILVNTELGSGTSDARGFPKVDPEDVANAIVEAIKHPRFDVHVPRRCGPLYSAATLLPRRGQDIFRKILKLNDPLMSIDQNKRAEYEQRASHSDSGEDL